MSSAFFDTVSEFGHLSNETTIFVGVVAWIRGIRPTIRRLGHVGLVGLVVRSMMQPVESFMLWGNLAAGMSSMHGHRHTQLVTAFRWRNQGTKSD
jgi:hypothetical protein